MSNQRAHIGLLKDGCDGEVLAEINAVKEACAGKTLKVIIETCLLTEDEKVRMCGIVSRSEADFIKTSTGFSTAGATFDDVALMKAHMADGNGGRFLVACGCRALYRAGRDASGHRPHRQARQKRTGVRLLILTTDGNGRKSAIRFPAVFVW